MSTKALNWTQGIYPPPCKRVNNSFFRVRRSTPKCRRSRPTPPSQRLQPLQCTQPTPCLSTAYWLLTTVYFYAALPLPRPLENLPCTDRLPTRPCPPCLR